MIFLSPATLNRQSRSTVIKAVRTNTTAPIRTPAPEAVGFILPQPTITEVISAMASAIWISDA
jgi:hypothetical protein